MALTMLEQTALAVTPKVTAGLSVFFSSIIVYLVLTDPIKRKKVFHRLILGMSMTDVATSFWWVMSTWPIPRESGTLWAVGTTRTCTCQGFWLQVGIANPLYNLSLSVYYLMAIHWSWGEAKMKKIEIFFHLGPLGWGIGTALAGLPLKIFNNANIWCWIADFPGRNEHTAPYRWGIFYAPLWLAAILVSINLAKVVTYFQRVTNKCEKHVVMNPSVYVSETEQRDQEYDVDNYTGKNGGGVPSAGDDSGESQEFADDAKDQDKQFELELEQEQEQKPEQGQGQRPGQEPEQEKQPVLQQRAGQDPEEDRGHGHLVEQMQEYDEVEPSFHSSMADSSWGDGDDKDANSKDEMTLLDELVAEFQNDLEDITSLFQQAMSTDAEESNHDSAGCLEEQQVQGALNTNTGTDIKNKAGSIHKCDKCDTEGVSDAEDGDVGVVVADPASSCVEASSVSASASTGAQMEETETIVEPQLQPRQLQLEQQLSTCHSNAIPSEETGLDMDTAKGVDQEEKGDVQITNENNAANTRSALEVPPGAVASTALPFLPLPVRLFARFRMQSMGAGTIGSYDRGSSHTRNSRGSRGSWTSRNNTTSSRFGHRRRRLAWQCLRYALVFYATWFPITLLRILQAAGKPIGFPILFLAALLTPLQGLPNFLVYLYPLFVEKFNSTSSPCRCIRAVWRKLFSGSSMIDTSSDRNFSPRLDGSRRERGQERRLRPRSQQTGLGPGAMFSSNEGLTPIAEEDRDVRGDGDYDDDDEESFQRATFFRFDHPCTVSSLDASQSDLLETTDPQFRWDVYERKIKEEKRGAAGKGTGTVEVSRNSDKNNSSNSANDGPPSLPARARSIQADDLDDKDGGNVSIGFSGIAEERATPQSSDSAINYSTENPSSNKAQHSIVLDSGHDSRPSKPQRIESESENKFYTEDNVDDDEDVYNNKIGPAPFYLRGRPMLDTSDEAVPPRKPVRIESRSEATSRFGSLVSEITMEDDFARRPRDPPV